MSRDKSSRRRAVVAELASLGCTRRQIADAINVDYVETCRLIREMGINLPYMRRGPGRSQAAKSRAAKMVALYKAGYTLVQIGEVYGITRERVRQLMTRHFGIRHADGGQSVIAAAARAKRKAAKDAQCMTKYGCTHAQYQGVLRVGREMLAAGSSRERTPRGAFIAQRRNARTRGIGWELTFWQWWTIWQESGHWEQRGRGSGYVMCRKGDEGPYAVGNVFIATSIENVSTGKHKKSDLPTGVHQAPSGRFTAHRQINGQGLYLGTFDTPDMAHAAYLMAGEQQAVAA